MIRAHRVNQTSPRQPALILLSMGMVIAVVWAIAHHGLLYPHDIAAVVGGATPPRGQGLFIGIRQDLRRWRGRWRGALLEVLLLPYNPINVLDTVSRALWRMFVSRQKMLEWRSAAEVSRHSAGLRAHLQRARTGSVFVLAILAASSALGKPSGLAYLLGFAWLAAPLLGAFLARPLGDRA